MKRRLIQAIGFAALAGLSTASAAQSNAPGGSMARMLLNFDGNNDGAITRDEARAGIAQRFARMDANGDGTVTRDERWGSRRADRFRSMDINGDGAVTLQEMEAAFQQRARSRFARLDADGNGALTLEEVQAQRPKNRGPMTLQLSLIHI